MHQAGYHTIRIILYFVYIMQQNKNKYPTSIDNRCAPTEVYSNTTCHWSLSTASSCMLAAVELVSCLYGFICSKSCCTHVNITVTNVEFRPRISCKTVSLFASYSSQCNMHTMHLTSSVRKNHNFIKLLLVKRFAHLQ